MKVSTHHFRRHVLDDDNITVLEVFSIAVGNVFQDEPVIRVLRNVASCQ
jgi:hypothetical protein